MNDKTISPSLQLLLDTAEALIVEKGCRGTTLQDIIDRSGLSKGAIYHYVKSKDELFGLVLQQRTETLDAKFFSSVSEERPGSMHLPLQTIAQGMHQAARSNDVGSTIFIYLLSQKGNPVIDGILKRLYEYGLTTTRKWIELGQQRDVIPEQLDAEKMASLFIMFMYGMRVKNMIDSESTPAGMGDIYELLMNALRK